MAARLSDISLAAQVAVFHNRRAFDQIVRQNQSAVRRFLLSLTLGDEALSDDLAQDTFLKAYLNIGQYRGQASLQTWLMRIAYNVYYDHRRRQQRRAESELPPPAVPTAGIRMDIYRALATLKDEERTCITLQLIDGETIDHISDITGLTPNTVKSHLRRGKERLATFLKNNGYDGTK